MSKAELAAQDEHYEGTVAALPATRALADVTGEIVSCNKASRSHEDLWSRTRQATDQVGHAATAVKSAEAAQEEAELACRAALAENLDRQAPRTRQRLIATGALALDAVACFFAAEALGGSQRETLAWTALFLAVLGAGEVALDHYRDGYRLVWRCVAFTLGAFVCLLGVLRFSFLLTVGSQGPVTAVTGAALFTVATAGFVVVGYRALRIAETGAAQQARRRVRARAGDVASARRKLARQTDERDRLATAYLSLIRLRLIRTCTADRLRVVELAVWSHLTDQDPS